MTNTEKRVEEFADQMIAWEMMTPPEEKAIQRPKMVLDYFKISIQQATAEEREMMMGEIEKKLQEVKPLYKFGDIIIDSQRMQDGTILGQQKALSDILSSLDTNPK